MSVSAYKFKVADVQKNEKFLLQTGGLADVGGYLLQKLVDDLKEFSFATGQANSGEAIQPENYHVAHGFVAAALTAYNQHVGLELTPDDLWAVIAYGVSQHLGGNKHIAENYRGQFVGHQGKKELEVVDLPDKLVDDPSAPENRYVWMSVLSLFEEKLKENTTTAISAILTSPFSTTGRVESTVFSGLLMETMKQYFKYVGIVFCCGIPEITLNGTVQDYQDILVRIEKLTHLLPDFSWWLNKMHGHAKKIYDSRTGAADIDYWSRMLSVVPYGSGGQTNISGWLRDFIPYMSDKSGRLVPQRNGVENLGDLRRPALTCTEIILKDPKNGVQYQVKLLAGFLGVCQDEASRNVRPALGWMIFLDPRSKPMECATAGTSKEEPMDVETETYFMEALAKRRAQFGPS